MSDTNIASKDSFQEGLIFFKEKEKEINENLLHSYLSWCDENFYQNKVILAHIVIDEPDCRCEIISLLTSYSVTCSGYNILIKNENQSWKLHTCVGKLKNVDCDECGNELYPKLGPYYISCTLLDRDEVSEEEFENHNSYDLCTQCAKKNPSLISKHSMHRLTTDSYDYFGFNTYSLSNFKNYVNWNRKLQIISDIKKPREVSSEEYKEFKVLQNIYWDLKMNQQESADTEKYEAILDCFKMDKLI